MSSQQLTGKSRHDGAEANLLPLRSFKSMFPHTLDGDGYPLDGFLSMIQGHD